MKIRFLSFLMSLLAVASITNLPHNGKVLGATTITNQDYTNQKIQMKTATAFDQEEIEEYQTIPYDTEYVDDDEMEYGTEEIIEEGENGTKTLTYLLTYWQDEILDKTLIDTKSEDPKTEVIAKGTKIVWKLHSTPDVGRVKYWYKMRVWATKYDANCIGCTGRTYSGTEVKKGVCATDPSVIPLGTNFYVDGYGLCRAEDIGGAIKGEKIDLGYVDASKGDWRTGYTDIYLLTNAPE